MIEAFFPSDFPPGFSQGPGLEPISFSFALVSWSDAGNPMFWLKDPLIKPNQTQDAWVIEACVSKLRVQYCTVL